VLFFSIRYSKFAAFAAAATLWTTLLTMAVLAPIRKLIGWRADKGYGWYRAAAAGAASGWRRKIVEPPTVPRA
jgi:hypothetical protein